MAAENRPQLYELHEKRLRDAIALKTPDRVPLALNGPAWPARALGEEMTQVATTPDRAYEIIIEAYSSLGEIEAIQSPAYDVSTLPVMWLSRVKAPGREFPSPRGRGYPGRRCSVLRFVALRSRSSWPSLRSRRRAVRPRAPRPPAGTLTAMDRLRGGVAVCTAGCEVGLDDFLGDSG